ncbi:MAG: CvpA family protein [Clostridiales bacterium]|nr:CvpA family protein [Clostridiales bacterium]
MIDIITAAVFVLFIVLGCKRGLLRSLYGIAALAASIIIAYLLYPYIKNLIADGLFGDWIRSMVKTKYVTPGLSANSLDVSSLPEYMKSMVDTGRIKLDSALTMFISNLVLNLLSFIAVFIVTRILISILGKLLHLISKLPVIHFFDKIGGAIFGLVESLLILYLIFAVIYAVTPLRDNPATKAFISDSTLTKTMYENNPLVEMVTPRDYDNMN